MEGQAEENFPFQSHSAMSRHKTSAQTQRSLCCDHVKTRLEEEFFPFKPHLLHKICLKDKQNIYQPFPSDNLSVSLRVLGSPRRGSLGEDGDCVPRL